MLKQFWPFVDYKKLIEIQANGNSYKFSKKNKGNKNLNQQVSTQKSKKLRRHQ